jgi:hypothetical protein
MNVSFRSDLMGRSFVLLAGLLAVAPPSSALAQGLPIRPNDRVRVFAERTWTGAVQSMSADSLVLRRDPVGNRLALSLASIRRLDVTDGRRPRGRTAAVGGAIGGGLGLVFGLLTRSSDCGVDRTSDVLGVGGGICDAVGTASMVLLPVTGILAGAGVGALVGGGERWTQVHPDPGVSVEVHGDGSVGVALRLGYPPHP